MSIRAMGMRILQSVLLLLFLIPPWMGEKRLPLLGPVPRCGGRRVGLDDANPGLKRVGQLTWLGGVELTSPDPAFGGFSAMAVTGDHFTLLSDGGSIVRFRMDSRGRLSDRSFAELPAGPGTGWSKQDRDSESMTVDPKTGQVWVGFERANAIWRFSRDLRRSEANAAPKVMAGWPANTGAEAMARLPDGGFIVIGERQPWPGHKGRAAIRFSGDPTLRPDTGFRFSYVPPDHYDPSDMAVLPDGRLLILNRRFALPFTFSTKLTVIDQATIRPGAVVRGREIATLASPLIHDNFEGLVVTREGRATIVWIVSDDNQLFLQRSLLLKFRLEPESR